jgi:hypothetical protein
MSLNLWIAFYCLCFVAPIALLAIFGGKRLRRRKQNLPYSDWITDFMRLAPTYGIKLCDVHDVSYYYINGYNPHDALTEIVLARNLKD